MCLNGDSGRSSDETTKINPKDEELLLILGYYEHVKRQTKEKNQVVRNSRGKQQNV